MRNHLLEATRLNTDRRVSKLRGVVRRKAIALVFALAAFGTAGSFVNAHAQAAPCPTDRCA
jgi:hypothetical protein